MFLLYIVLCYRPSTHLYFNVMHHVYLIMFYKLHHVYTSAFLCISPFIGQILSEVFNNITSHLIICYIICIILLL